MHDNQLHEDGLAKHEFLMEQAAEWRQTRNLPATTRPAASPVRRMQPIPVTMVNLLIKH